MRGLALAAALLALAGAARGSEFYGRLPAGLEDAVKQERATARDAETLIELARSSPDPDARRQALELLGERALLGRPFADGAFIARLRTLAKDEGKDPVNDVRYAAGDLSRSLNDWDGYWSPAATARRQARERHEQLMSDLGRFAYGGGTIAIVLLAALVVIAGQVVAAFLVVNGAELLETEARSSWRLLFAHPALFLLPLCSAGSFAGLLGFSFYKAFTRPLPPGAGDAALYERVMRLVYEPTSLLAVLAAFVVAALANAAYLGAHLRRRRGDRDAGLLQGLAEALRCLGAIVSLSLVVCAVLIGADWLLRRLRRYGFSPPLLAQFGGLLLESSVMLAFNTALCVMLAEDKGPAEAAARAISILKPQWRLGLRAVTATAILRGDPVKTAVIAPALCWMPSMVFFIDDKYGYWLLNGGLVEIPLAWMALGLVCASFLLSMVWLLDAVFAAAFYLHAAGVKPLPEGLVRRLEAGAPMSAPEAGPAA